MTHDPYEGIRPVTDSLKNFKPVGWAWPERSTTTIREDGSIEIHGLHLFEDKEQR